MVITVQGHTINLEELVTELEKVLPLELELETCSIKKDKYIEVCFKSFKKTEMGVFALGIKEAQLQTFTTELLFNKSVQADVWFAQWDIRYTLVAGGSNGINIATTWYNTKTKEWTSKTAR